MSALYTHKTHLQPPKTLTSPHFQKSFQHFFSNPLTLKELSPIIPLHKR